MSRADRGRRPYEQPIPVGFAEDTKYLKQVELMAKYGASRQRVRRWMDELGIGQTGRCSQRPWTGDDLETLIAVLDSGGSLWDASAKLGRTEGAVRNKARKVGLVGRKTKLVKADTTPWPEEGALGSDEWVEPLAAAIIHRAVVDLSAAYKARRPYYPIGQLEYTIEGLERFMRSPWAAMLMQSDDMGEYIIQKLKKGAHPKCQI